MAMEFGQDLWRVRARLSATYINSKGNGKGKSIDKCINKSKGKIKGMTKSKTSIDKN